MKKRLISIFVVVAILLTTMPTMFVAMAAETNIVSGPDLTKDGVIIVKNDVANDPSPDAGFRVGHTDSTTGWSHGEGEIIDVDTTTKLQYQAWESNRVGYGDKNALVLNNGYGMYADWRPFPTNDTSKAGTYEVWVYLPELEATMANSGAKPLDKVAGGRVQFATPGLHAVYTVRSKSPNYIYSGDGATAQASPNANLVEPRYYVNQYEVLDGKAGWFKLGDTHYFGGTSSDYVRLSTYRWYENAYASAVAFVPVDRPSSAKLAKVHTAVNSSAKTSVDDLSAANVTRILQENVDVTSNSIAITIPTKFGGGTDASGNTLYRKAYLIFEAEDKDAKIYYGDRWLGNGVGFFETLTTAGTVTDITLTVVSQDDSETEYYDISVVANENNQNEYRVSTAANFGKDTEYNAPYFDGVKGVDTRTGQGDRTRMFTPVRYPSTDQMYNNENVALCAEWNTRLMLDNLGAHGKWTPGDLSEGLHAVYVYPNATAKGHAEHAEVIINHAGLRESVAIKPGQYHAEQIEQLNALNGVYVGTFYFDGEGDESIVFMKSEEKTDWTQTGEDLGWSNAKYLTGHVDARLRIQGLHLESAPYYNAASDFDGVVVTAGSASANATKAMIEDGGYVMPIAANNAIKASVKVIGSNNKYEYIKVNGQEVVLTEDGDSIAPAKSPVEIDVTPGINTVELQIKLKGRTEKTYNFDVFCENEDNSVTAFVDSTLINTTFAPLSTDYAPNKVGYLKDNAVADFMLNAEGSADAGYYKILAWKPGFTFETYDLDAVFNQNTTPYGTESQVVTIHDGTRETKKVVDWSATDCRWVDLGQIYFNGSDACRVTFENSSDDKSLLESVKFLKLDEGVEINGKYFAESDLAEGNIIETESSAISIKNCLSSSITVNDVAIAVSETREITVKNGINIVKFTIGGETYDVIILNKGQLIMWDDDCVTFDGEDEPTDSSLDGGLNNTGYAKVYGTDTVFKPENLVGGTSKVYAYFTAVPEEDLIEEDVTVVDVSANIDGTKVVGNSVTPTSEGWIEVGTFNFAGNGTDEIVFSTGVYYISAIRIVPNVLNATKPVIEVIDGTASASSLAYATSDITVCFIIATYDKTSHQLKDVKLKECSVTNDADYITSENISVDSTSYVKAFVWEGTTSLTPLAPNTER